MDQTSDEQQTSEMIERAQDATACLVGGADREQQVSALVARLELVRLRKASYFWPVDGKMAKVFAFGFYTAAQALGWEGIYQLWKIWLKAGERRGWKIQADWPIPEMEKRGMSDEEMADEVLAIEIEAWRLWLSENEKPAAE
jgi:hypothetical protein